MKLIAHGGFPKKYKENSLEGYLAAVKFMPYAIEMDVVLHPTSNDLICAHPLELMSENSNSKDKGSITVSQYPLLSSILEKIPNSSKIVLDLKQETPELINAVLNTVGKSQQQRLILGLRNIELFKYTIQKSHDIETLALFSIPALYREFANLGGRNFRLWEKEATPETIKELHQANLLVWVTPGTKGTPSNARSAGEINEKVFRRLVSAGVDAVLVNDIESASKWNEIHLSA